MKCTEVTKFIEDIRAKADELSHLDDADLMLAKQWEIGSMVKECKQEIWQGIHEVERFELGEGEILDLSLNAEGYLSYLERTPEELRAVYYDIAKKEESIGGTQSLAPYMSDRIYWTGTSSDGWCRFVSTSKDRKIYLTKFTPHSYMPFPEDAFTASYHPICLCVLGPDKVLFGDFSGIGEIRIGEGRIDFLPISKKLVGDVVTEIRHTGDRFILGTTLGKVFILDSCKTVLSDFVAFPQDEATKYQYGVDDIAYTKDCLLLTCGAAKKTVVFDFTGNKMAEIEETGKVTSLDKYLILSVSKMLYIFDPGLEEFLEINLRSNEDWQPTSIDAKDGKIYIGTNTGEVIVYSTKRKAQS